MSLKTLYRKLRGLFPSRLPIGMGEFELWVKAIEDTYELPTVDSDSIKYVLAATIIHLGPQVAYKSKHFFYLTLLAAGNKQVASQAFQDVKLRQQQKQSEQVTTSELSK